jgi:hypothetical protein
MSERRRVDDGGVVVLRCDGFCTEGVPPVSTTVCRGTWIPAETASAVPLVGDERYAAPPVSGGTAMADEDKERERSERERRESEEEPRRRRGNGSILPLTREQIEKMKKKA